MKTSLRSFGLFALVLALFVPALADTIRLKDGNVIRGQVIGFRDQQFTVLVGSGTQGRRSRTLVYVEDVESIEFDSATTAAAASLANEDPHLKLDAAVSPPPQSPSADRQVPRAQLRICAQTSPTFFTIKVVLTQSSARTSGARRGMCAEWLDQHRTGCTTRPTSQNQQHRPRVSGWWSLLDSCWHDRFPRQRETVAHRSDRRSNCRHRRR